MTQFGYFRYLGSTEPPIGTTYISGSDIKCTSYVTSSEEVKGNLEFRDTVQFPYTVYDGNVISTSSTVPSILTRLHKGQALTHLEMDFNLASLYHTLSLSPAAEYSGDNPYLKKRAEEQEGMWVYMHYAPILIGEDNQVRYQNQCNRFKVKETTDETLLKLKGESIPGHFGVAEDLWVTGSGYVYRDLSVSGSTNVLGNGSYSGSFAVQNHTRTNTLWVTASAGIGSLGVRESASIGQDLYVKGNVFVDGVIYGDVRHKEYFQGETTNFSASGVWDNKELVTRALNSDLDSDIRLKSNLRPISSRSSLRDVVTYLKGYRFDWNELSDNEGVDIGVIAQDVQKILPEAVHESPSGYLQVSYIKIIPLLVEAIRELKWEVDELRSQLK